MHASNKQTNTDNTPLNKIELIALIFFSAMMFYFISQVFLQAHKNKAPDINVPAKVENVIGQHESTINEPVSEEQLQATEIVNPDTSVDVIDEVVEETDEEIIEPVTDLVNEIFSDIEITNLQNQKKIAQFCETVGEKLGSVNVQDCKNANLQLSGTASNQNKPLTFRDFSTQDSNEVSNGKTRILLVGGIHGDEFSGVSIAFKWLNKLAKDYSSNTTPNINNYHWRVIPILNPDGLLQGDGESKRMNANDVDLNRNFPTEDWDEFAHKFWINKRGRDPRRFPGPEGGSEIETQWIVEQINEFNPHAVISIHAPYGIVDSDGPIDPPKHLGPLQLKILGTYPGSMGRYVGVQKNIPMLTVELKRAGTMPSQHDIDLIWEDIQKWIDKKVLNNEAVAAMQSIRHEDDDTVIDKKAGD